MSFPENLSTLNNQNLFHPTNPILKAPKKNSLPPLKFHSKSIEIIYPTDSEPISINGFKRNIKDLKDLSPITEEFKKQKSQLQKCNKIYQVTLPGCAKMSLINQCGHEVMIKNYIFMSPEQSPLKNINNDSPSIQPSNQTPKIKFSKSCSNLMEISQFQ